ncbi:MAG TPA: TMEM175 family protein [Candidatus Nanoarchaeia archaeon]|nr:TMEM175 family protein [Candidatus Nanoarchaeia archaeon]
MAEEKTRSQPKSRIETLSDLIFGLALSIGAIALIGQPPSDFTKLLFDVFYYAFSFLILILVWYSYTRIMSYQHVETLSDIYLNVLLLFLVSIEPFLFNELIFSPINGQYTSMVYAANLGGLFVMLALLTNSILSDKNSPLPIKRHYQLLRDNLLIGAAIFFVSALPVFWTWAIPINGTIHVQLRYLLWVAPLLLRARRRLVDKK